MGLLRSVKRWWLNFCIGMDVSHAEELRSILRNKSCTLNHLADATALLERAEKRIEFFQKKLEGL